MKFDIQNRIVLLGLLPVTGDITSLKQIRVLREALAFNDKEAKALNIQTLQNGSVKWNPGHNVKAKEIKIGDVMVGVIRGLLEEKNTAKALHENQIGLWDLFFPDKK
jgi:hypothetical protein